MRLFRSGALLIGAAAVVAWSSPAAWATDADVFCKATKLRALGQYARCQLNEHAQAVKQEATPDFTKCDGQLLRKWTAADDKGGADCPATIGTLATPQSATTTHAADVASMLAGSTPPDFRCEAQKLVAAGRYEQCRMNEWFRSLKAAVGPNFSQCDFVLEVRWAAIDQADTPDCPGGVGAVAPVQTAITDHTDTMEASLTPP